MTTDLYFSLLGKGLTPKTIAISINDSKTLQTLFEMRLTHRCWHKQQCLQCHGIPHHNGLMTMGKEPNHKTGLKQCEMDNRPFTCIDDIVNCLCWGILENRKPIIILFRFICRWEAAPEDYVSVKKMFRKFTKLQRKSEENAMDSFYIKRRQKCVNIQISCTTLTVCLFSLRYITRPYDRVIFPMGFPVPRPRIDQLHKSHNASVPYHTIHHSEQKCIHFCSEWWIVGYGAGALWDL